MDKKLEWYLKRRGFVITRETKTHLYVLTWLDQEECYNLILDVKAENDLNKSYKLSDIVMIGDTRDLDGLSVNKIVEKNKNGVHFKCYGKCDFPHLNSMNSFLCALGQITRPRYAIVLKINIKEITTKYNLNGNNYNSELHSGDRNI